MAILELKGVSAGYGTSQARTEVLKDVDLTVEEGEVLAILGFSGTGKTTLISLLAGLRSPDKGEVLFKGQRVTGPGPERGVVFQTYALMPWLTVWDNIGLAVDANVNGQIGGVRFIDFDTLGVTTLPGTAVFGRVFASELVGVGDGETTTSLNVPLEGATISVDGFESTLFAVTNAMGDFRLEPAPVGKVSSIASGVSRRQSYAPKVDRWTSRLTPAMRTASATVMTPPISKSKPVCSGLSTRPPMSPAVWTTVSAPCSVMASTRPGRLRTSSRTTAYSMSPSRSAR